MTPPEFKAWFDGFTEAIDKAPTQKQWARIRERVSEIDGRAVTERIFVDRYLATNPYRYPYYTTTIQNYPTVTPTVWSSVGLASQSAQGVASGVHTFNSTNAMHALGKADAQSMN